MKTCTKCKIKKELLEFGVRRASKDGLSPMCKACQSEYDKSRANLPHRVKARKEYAKTDKGREAANRAKKKWTERNGIKRAAIKLFAMLLEMGN